MACLDYEIVEYNIKILNIKLQRIYLNKNLLFLSKPGRFFKKKYDKWHDEMNKLLEEEIIIHGNLFNEYQKIEKLLSQISQ